MRNTLFSLVVAVARAQSSGESCGTPNVYGDALSRNGTNVVVPGPPAGSPIYLANQDLPELPQATRTVAYGVPLIPDADGKYGGFDGVIKFGGIWSLTRGSTWYAYAQQMRRGQQMAIDLIHARGGIRIGNLRYGINAFWVDDMSSRYQVTNATAFAARGYGADFLFAGYSSGLTTFTTKQAYANGKIMMAPGAASTPVFTQNDLSFGTLVPANAYFALTLVAIADKAAAIDAGTVTSPFSSRCADLPDGPTCMGAIKVGFIQAGAAFTRSMCNGGASGAAAAGLTVVNDAAGTGPLRVEIPKVPTFEQALAGVQELQAAGVTVIIGCTYSATANRIIDALHNISWAPLTVGFSSTIGGAAYAASVQRTGGYKYEYMIGYSIWQAARAGTGAFTGWTSAQFESEFMGRYEGTKPSYHGASGFMGPIVYAAAIEAANSINTTLVRDALNALDFEEFYARINFDTNGQLSASMMTIQFVPNASKTSGATVDIVYPPAASSAEFAFPMPDWPIRACWDKCSSVSGHCDPDGTCRCDSGYQGEYCDERVIIVQDNTSTYILAGVLGPIVGLLILYGIYKAVVFVRRAIRLAAAEEERKIGVCRQAIKAATTLQSTAYLVSFGSLKKMGKLTMHEEARKAGLLECIDDYEELIKFATDNPVVFFSHQWLAWAEPDPDRIQYNEMIAAAQVLCERNGYDPEDLYIFLDILSIPQKNMRQRLCAIETLGCFASIFEHFVIIAPDSVHKDTKVACNKVSYGRRGWCRLEQWGHLAVSGTTGMYFYNGKDSKLEPISDSGDDWFLDSIKVLGGDYTVGTYDSKKELVNTILGLYAMTLNGKDDATQKLYNLVEKHMVEVFPTEYFGDLPSILKRLMDVEDKGHKKAKIDVNKSVTADEITQIAVLKKSATALAGRTKNAVKGAAVQVNNFTGASP